MINLTWILVLLLPALSLAQCPGNAVYSNYTDRCFLINPNLLSWSAAWQYCKQLGGDLASIHSDDENNLVYSMMLTQTDNCQGPCYSTWLGLTYNSQIGQYVWTDGTPMDYNDWMEGEPTRALCGWQIWYVPMWGTYNCNSLQPSACTVPKLSAQPTLAPTTPSPQNVTCPNGSLSYNGKCYLFVNNATSWNNARSQCLMLDGDLVSIHNAFENNFVSTNARRAGLGIFWIGLSTQLTGGVNYTWSDGSSLDYSNWNSAVPGSCSNGPQSCVNSDSGSSQWYNCWDPSHALGYVCELGIYSLPKKLSVEKKEHQVELMPHELRMDPKRSNALARTLNLKIDVRLKP